MVINFSFLPFPVNLTSSFCLTYIFLNFQVNINPLPEEVVFNQLAQAASVIDNALSREDRASVELWDLLVILLFRIIIDPKFVVIEIFLLLFRFILADWASDLCGELRWCGRL